MDGAAELPPCGRAALAFCPNLQGRCNPRTLDAVSSTETFDPRAGEPALDSRAVQWLLVASGAYVAASLIANVLSVRIVMIGNFSVDAGTLAYPLTFTLRDVVHKVGGVRSARTVVFATAGMNVLLALGVWSAGLLRADPSVGDIPSQTQFSAVLGLTSRVIAASIIAQVVAELIDTQAYQLWVSRFGAKYQWGRVLSSNAISVPVDSVTFVAIAFWGEMPASTAVSIIWANILIKGVTSIVSFPLIYTVRDRQNFRAAMGEAPAPAS